MANQIARPDADDTDGNWTDKDGGTTLYTSIDDTSTGDDATTFIKVADQFSNEVCIVRLEDVDTPVSGDAWIKYKALTEDNGMGQPGLKLELLQGSTVKATTTNSSVDTSSFTSYSYTISDVSGISDWTDLKLRITMITNTGGNELMKVTQAYLETQEAGGASVPIAAISMNTYRQMRN
jgi:hypothetical protein